MSDVFYAYPSGYLFVNQTIEAAAQDAISRHGVKVRTWPQVDIAGKFIATEILQEINRCSRLAADVSFLNFNVTFELGYAIGLGKPVVLTRLAAVTLQSNKLVEEIGIFDTLGYQLYQNRDE